jgi:uncharacterized lipoprotein
MEKIMRKTIISGALIAVLSGCAVVAEKTNFLNDDDVRRESARALGLQPDEVKLVSRATEGTNTYAVLQAKNGKKYTCTLNGGNLLTAGMVNPPQCKAQ